MRSLRLTISVATMTSAALVLAACGSSGTSAAANGTSAAPAPSGSQTSATSGKQIVIGWADPQGKQPLFQTFTQALDAAAARANVKVVTLDGGADPSKQVSDIQTFITQKVDAIVVFPLVPQAENTILQKAAKAGIKIIGLNAIMPPAYKQVPQVKAPYDTNLDWGYVATGYEGGKFVAKKLGGKGNVVGIKIPVPVPSLDAMMSAYQKYVTEGNHIHWLGILPDKTDDLAGARQAMADAITRYKGNIQGVLAYDDNAALGAYQAVQAAGLKNVVIVGQQGNPTYIQALKQNKIQGDLGAKPCSAALWTLQMVRDVVGGKAYPKFVHLPVTFYTQANVNTYTPWPQCVTDIKSGKTPLNVTFPAS